MDLCSAYRSDLQLCSHVFEITRVISGFLQLHLYFLSSLVRGRYALWIWSMTITPKQSGPTINPVKKTWAPGVIPWEWWIWCSIWWQVASQVLFVAPRRLRARTAGDQACQMGYGIPQLAGSHDFWTKRSVEEWLLLGSRDWLKFQDLIVISVSETKHRSLQSKWKFFHQSFKRCPSSVRCILFWVGSSTWRCQAITDLKAIVIHILYGKPSLIGYLANLGSTSMGEPGLIAFATCCHDMCQF